MSESTVAIPQASPQQAAMSVFRDVISFELAQRMATALSKSDLVPQAYRGNVANAMIALEMANRIGASPLMVMQNLHVIHGRPSWSSTFIIAAIDASKRFSSLRFEVTGQGDARTCYAWAMDGDQRLEGPPVSIAMAKAEGWYSRSGSKWQTMPELMIRYRAAAFFGRLYAADLLMGMHTADEVDDFAAPAKRTPIPADVAIHPATPAPAAPTTVIVQSGTPYPEKPPEPPTLEREPGDDFDASGNEIPSGMTAEEVARIAEVQRAMAEEPTIDATLADTICREMTMAGVTWPQMLGLMRTRYQINTDTITTVRDLHDDEAAIVRKHLAETAANKGRNGKAVAK